jgi:transcription elongation factor S-II|tara:strand:- start:413 stop:958 length:546 start_codon:yes stop_codon:yes gene_type:complete
MTSQGKMIKSSYNDEIRNRCALLLDKELNNEKISRQIEKSIYNDIIKDTKKNNIKRIWSNIHFKSIYISRIRSIYSNIKPDSYLRNTTFRDKILSGEIDATKVSEMSHYDMFPENWQELIEKNMKKDKLKYELKPEAMTDIFKCRKCSSRSCTYYEVQTRSADEPMTQFITCLDCNNNWKQ